MDKIKILVACHKPEKVFQNEVYVPIHVGRAVSQFKNEMPDMIGDDTGDNISEKNPYYSELTAQYWAWKNMNDVEYIGFCHYRRFFELQINNNNIDQILRKHEVVLLEGADYYIVERNVLQSLAAEDLAIMLTVLKKLYPDYEQDALRYLYSFKHHYKNMLICRKELFNNYATWLFNILTECEKYVRLSPYTRGKRVFAYLGEFLMPVYFMHHHYRIYSTRFVNSYGRKYESSFKSETYQTIAKIHALVAKRFVLRPQTIEQYISQDVKVGLSIDGIEIKKQIKIF